MLYLDSESSTVGSCYCARLLAYGLADGADCGPNLRILCTAVDSDRTSIAATSQQSYVEVLDQFNSLSILACVAALLSNEL